MVSRTERRILDHFRREYAELRTDLEAFTAAFDAADFEGWGKADIRDWCVAWWEERLGGRMLDHGGRRLGGARGEN